MVREKHRRHQKQAPDSTDQPETNNVHSTAATSTINVNHEPTVCSIPFGRNYYYPLATYQERGHSVATAESSEDDKDATDNDEADIISTSLPLPWNHDGSREHQLPISATCSSQSTIIVSPIDGKVYQTGTMHGVVYKNWKHIVIPIPSKCVQVSAGRHFWLARMENGVVLSCGAGHFGQLGVVVSNKTHLDDDDDDDDDEDDSCGSVDNSINNNERKTGNERKTDPSMRCITFTSQPVLIERLLPSVIGSPIQSVAAGDFHALALTVTGQVWAWGSNRSLQCGIPLNKDATKISSTMGSIALPLPIPQLPHMKQIAAGRAHSCALSADGIVYCWGNSSLGQCGTGTTMRRSIKGLLPSPIQGIPPSLEMIQISGKFENSFATLGLYLDDFNNS
jgi:alpha-tubulin suppressor-like RCC1 family protein